MILDKGIKDEQVFFTEKNDWLKMKMLMSQLISIKKFEISLMITGEISSKGLMI